MRPHAYATYDDPALSINIIQQNQSFVHKSSDQFHIYQPISYSPDTSLLSCSDRLFIFLNIQENKQKIKQYHHQLSPQFYMHLRKILTSPILKRYFQFCSGTTSLATIIEKLKKDYQTNQYDFSVFKPYISTSSDCFKIFRALEQSPYHPQSYYSLIQTINDMKVKTDNILLLKAKIHYRLAEELDSQRKHKQAQELYLKGLQELQNSVIPPILHYYQIYRHYGLSLYESGEYKQALQVLKQSTGILQDYIAQSEDPVSSQRNSINQARAYLKLAKLDEQDKGKWLDLSNKYWKECDEEKLHQRQYAQTLYENAIEKKKSNTRKAQAYIYHHEELLPNQELKEIIRKAL